MALTNVKRAAFPVHTLLRLPPPTERHGDHARAGSLCSAAGPGGGYCGAANWLTRPIAAYYRNHRSYFPSWQSYKTRESSSLLEIMVSPLELKSKQLILSEFSRNTFATLKLRSTLSVSFMMASVWLGRDANPRSTVNCVQWNGTYYCKYIKTPWCNVSYLE